jgi:hypothetical protein
MNIELSGAEGGRSVQSDFCIIETHKNANDFFVHFAQFRSLFFEISFC